MTTRHRLLGVLFGGSALGTIAYIMAITVTAIVAEDITGSARWSGVPAAAATLGSALGAPWLSRIMDRRGRRPGLAAGLGIAAAGAGGAAAATISGSFGALIIGMLTLGIGRAAYQLARYAAADLQPPEGRAKAISWLVWAGTIGSIAGPQLLAPTESWAATSLGVGLAGPYAGAGAVFAFAALGWFLLLRPDPATAGVETRPRLHPAGPSRVPVPASAWTAMAAMWLGQYVMVQVMAMTPVFLSSIGETLAVVGGVISVHTLGMFAFSPVTGWLASRVGARRVIVLGTVTLVVAASLGFAGSEGRLLVLYPALFLLGLGWNFTFVAGSALLLDEMKPGEGVRLQGMADAGVWVMGGLANIAAGLLLDAAGFATLNVIAGVLGLVPAAAVAMERRRATILR